MLEGSQSFMWTFYADLVIQIPLLFSHFATARWIASAAGILWDRQKLAPQKKAANILRFAVL